MQHYRHVRISLCISLQFVDSQFQCQHCLLKWRKISTRWCWSQLQFVGKTKLGRIPNASLSKSDFDQLGKGFVNPFFLSTKYEWTFSHGTIFPTRTMPTFNFWKIMVFITPNFKSQGPLRIFIKPMSLFDLLLLHSLHSEIKINHFQN